MIVPHRLVIFALLDRVGQGAGEVEEELGFLEYAQGGAELLSLDCVFEDGEKDLVGSVCGDCISAIGA